MILQANSLKIENEVTNGVANGDVADNGLKKQWSVVMGVPVEGEGRDTVWD